MARKLVLLFSALLATAGAASAQLIHVTIQGTVLQAFSVSPLGPGPGAPALLELHYDASLTPQPVLPGDPFATYLPADATQNYWMLTYGSARVTRPLQEIAVSNSALWTDTFDFATLTTLSLELKFASDPSPGFALPVPPFPALAPNTPAEGSTGYASTFSFDTLSGWDYPAGSIVVGVDSVSAVVLPLTPAAIPEPSTYGLIAAALLAGAVIVKRRQRRREKSA